ncbi:hypothetical protein V8J82_03080 [Gymnodinialimonas sp. 2305UL16-5]|uniref:hypothetical protein n=1 Tax=Gymnodinialimonas mytili TaxID=3126503 RepID=UPI0030A35E54
MISVRVLGLALLGLAACGPAPSDVSVTPSSPSTLDGRVVPANAAQAPINGVTPSGAIPPAGRFDPLPGQIPTASTPDGGTDSLIASAESAIAEAEANTGGDTSIFTAAPDGDPTPRPVIPRVAAFALQTTHAPGQRIWRRNPLRRQFQIGCETFDFPDTAQDRFLAEGGPDRDPFGMDPDGDGFVCGFDPAPLRAEAAG